MKIYGSLESLLEYSPKNSLNNFQIQKKPLGQKSPDSLENFLQEKVTCLTDILFQIQSEVKNRKNLSQKIIDRIYYHYCYLKSNLLQLYDWGLGSNRAIEIRRIRLEKQLDTLLLEKRTEQVKCWNDIALLNKDFRNWFKQYCDLAQRVNLILSDNNAKSIQTKF